MARIAGIDLPRNKRTDIGLSYIYGIGRISAQKILDEAGIDGAVRVKDLSEDKIVKLREIIERDYRVEGDLRKEVSLNIKRLIDTGTYRGLRHRKGLPVRGQRTKTNARTRKGRGRHQDGLYARLRLQSRLVGLLRGPAHRRNGDGRKERCIAGPPHGRADQEIHAQGIQPQGRPPGRQGGFADPGDRQCPAAGEERTNPRPPPRCR